MYAIKWTGLVLKRDDIGRESIFCEKEKLDLYLTVNHNYNPPVHFHRRNPDRMFNSEDANAEEILTFKSHGVAEVVLAEYVRDAIKSSANELLAKLKEAEVVTFSKKDNDQR